MARFAASLLVLAVLSLEASSFVFPVAPSTGTSARTASAHSTRVCPAVSHRTAGRGVVLQSTTDKVSWILRVLAVHESLFYSRSRSGMNTTHMFFTADVPAVDCFNIREDLQSPRPGFV